MDITNFNFDIMNIIYNNLDYIDIINVSSTNKYFYNMLKENNKYIYSNKNKYITICDTKYEKSYYYNYFHKIKILDNIINIIPNIKIKLIIDTEHYYEELDKFPEKYELNVYDIFLECNNYRNVIYDLDKLNKFKNLNNFKYENINSTLLELNIDIPTIDLSLNNIVEIKIENNLNNLTSLNLNNTIDNDEMYNLDFLQYLNNLTELNLRNNNIYNIDFLKYLTNIRILNLSYNNIDIESLNKYNLNNIQILILTHNNLNYYKLDNLSNLITLTDLNLSHNNLTTQKCYPLSKLINLTKLNLSYNNIIDFNFVNNLDIKLLIK